MSTNLARSITTGDRESASEQAKHRITHIHRTINMRSKQGLRHDSMIPFFPLVHPRKALWQILLTEWSNQTSLGLCEENRDWDGAVFIISLADCLLCLLSQKGACLLSAKSLPLSCCSYEMSAPVFSFFSSLAVITQRLDWERSAPCKSVNGEDVSSHTPLCTGVSRVLLHIWFRFRRCTLLLRSS